jgi:hypothetical protein
MLVLSLCMLNIPYYLDVTAVREYQHKQFRREHEENNTAKKNPDQYNIFLDEINARVSLFSLSLSALLFGMLFRFSSETLFTRREFPQNGDGGFSRDAILYYPFMTSREESFIFSGIMLNFPPETLAFHRNSLELSQDVTYISRSYKVSA